MIICGSLIGSLLEVEQSSIVHKRDQRFGVLTRVVQERGMACATDGWAHETAAEASARNKPYQTAAKHSDDEKSDRQTASLVRNFKATDMETKICLMKSY